MNRTKLVLGLAAALGAWLVAQNVGIGTSSPDSRLHVHNPSGTAAIRVGHFENLNDAANNNGGSD
jgi:ATP-dependent protease ClpP protease subunit